MIHLPYIYNVYYKFVKCRVLIVYQIKIHNKCSKRPAPKSIHAWAYTTLSLRTQGSCRRSEKHTTRVGEPHLYFQLWLNTPGFLSVSTDKNLKD